ncbi:MAG: hypothetical protein QOF78_141 [Phycisphaerales bacterium]|jgi:hypothetical protein|nr:hypothetical protein [Phycisphaerales bacterium]
MRIFIPLVLATLLVCSPGCDDTPAEREQKVDNAAEKTGDALQKAAEKTGDALNKAADSTGKVINQVADEASRVKVDVKVATRPAATTTTSP